MKTVTYQGDWSGGVPVTPSSPWHTTSPAEVVPHQHQDVRVENGVQFGDLVEFCDFEYIAGVARVNGAALWSLAQGAR